MATYQIVRSAISPTNAPEPNRSCQTFERFAELQVNGLYTATGDSVWRSSLPSPIASIA